MFDKSMFFFCSKESGYGVLRFLEAILEIILIVHNLYLSRCKIDNDVIRANRWSQFVYFPLKQVQALYDTFSGHYDGMNPLK